MQMNGVCRHRLAVSVFVLAATAALLAAAGPSMAEVQVPATPSVVSGASDFCGRALIARKCPSPPVPPTLDLNTLLGSYYEIGSTARYKLRNELGMACTRTNFTVDAPNSNSDVVSVNVLSAGVPIVRSPHALSALSRIASASADVCSGAASICSMMSPQSSLYEASLRLSAAGDQLLRQATAAASSSSSSSSPGDGSLPEGPSPLDAAALSRLAVSLNATSIGAHQRLDRLARAVSGAVGAVAFGLNQGAAATPALEGLLEGLRSGFTLATDTVRDLASMVAFNLTTASNTIGVVLSHIPPADTSDSRDLLDEALSLIASEIDQIINQSAALQGQLITIEGPLVEMVLADYRGGARPASASSSRTSAASNSASTADDGTGADPGSSSNNTTLPPPRVMRRTGRATVQNPGAAATAQIEQSMDQEIAMPSQSLQIIAIEGGVPAGMGEYSALLVYMCDDEAEDEDGQPATDLVLLSRTPTLAPQTIVSLLETAASYGIYTDCDNPFVPTLQRADDCAAFFY